MLQQVISMLWQRFQQTLRPWKERLSEQAAPILGQAREYYRKLERREQILVQIAAVLIGAILLYNLIYLPAQNFKASINDRIQLRQRELAEVRRLAAVYADLKKSALKAQSKAVSKGGDLSLFSIVQAVLARSVERDKVASIKPARNRHLAGGFTQMSVDLKLSKVSLQQTVDVLFRLRKEPTPVGVSDLHVSRRRSDSRSYDVELTCVALARGD